MQEQSPARGAQSRADRQFRLPRRRSRQQQVRHVRTGDQQHESDCREQNPQRQPRVSHHLVEQRRKVHAGTDAGVGKLLGQALLYSLHFRASLRECNTRFQPPEHLQPVAAARCPREIGESEWQPQSGVFGEAKALRHHTDNGVIAPVVTIKREGSPQNVGIAAETALPQALAQHDHTAPGGHFFFRGEPPP